MKLGIYKNHAGAVLTVTHRYDGSGRLKTLGGIYVANGEGFFGQDTYLVTPQSMRDAGYEPTGEARG